jgi:hypothetical protein
LIEEVNSNIGCHTGEGRYPPVRKQKLFKREIIFFKSSFNPLVATDHDPSLQNGPKEKTDHHDPSLQTIPA